MTKPVSIQQRIRILDAQGVSWREIARRIGVSRDTVRKYATMEDRSPKPAAGKGRRSLIDAHSGTVDSWLSADRLMPRKQRHTARRVYARLVEEEGFEGSYSSVRRYVRRWREEHRSDGDGYLELDWGAGVMQVDFGEAVATIGGGGRQGPLPGRHVPALEHAVRGRDAGRERGMRVRGAGPDLRPHRHGSPRAGVRQRHRRGPPRRVEQGHRGARVRHVLRPLPARDEVLQPVFRQREGVCRERGRLPAPQPHGPQAQRGESQAAGEASAVEARRDRGRGPPPFRQADTRAVRRGPRGTAAAAARVSTRSNGSSARPTRRATSRSARSVTSRARHGAAGRCSPACARSRRRSAPPTAGT